MIGNVVTNDHGEPLDNNGTKLSRSSYQPPKALMDLFARCQKDYNTAWQLQHRPFDEFDGVSLLERSNLDQKTFAAHVGMEYVPKHKQWRWKGRKNTARNKIIGILAQVIAAILIPTVFATDDQENESRDCAKSMRILVQEHLRRAGYEIKFIYAVLSALVNPAAFVEIEYVEKMQNIKVHLANGEMQVEQAIDELMSGLTMNIVPIDELLLGDFFTFDMQAQPYLVRVRRISYDVARGIYAGKYFDRAAGDKMVDRFNYVEAGKTRVFLASQEGQMLFDIEWTEADRTMVQEVTFLYRGEDLEVTWVGGVFMGNFNEEKPEEVFNINPFKHRRMVQVGDAWGSMPVYRYAKAGYEPLDPQMRFAYYKSAAFKEYWDDATLNMASRLLIDGMHLDVLKPILISGISKYDSQVIAPAAVAALPKDATVSPYQLGPNLAAAMQVLERQAKDLEDSTIASVLQGRMQSGVTATNVVEAVNNAKKMLGVFGALIGDLMKNVGELTIDCIIINTTVGEMREELPGSLGMRFQTMLARSRDNGRSVTHKIVMTDRYIGRRITPAQKRAREWELYEQAGGSAKDAVKIWEINPYQFARRKYSCFVDVEQMVLRSTGADRLRKDRALAVLTSPVVAPFTDPEAVVNDFAIEEYGGDDPDRYKRKGNSADSIARLMGAMAPGEKPMETAGAVDAGAAKVGLPA